MKNRTFQNVLERLPQSFDSGRLLDVGCATGEMLAVANDWGFDVYGVEISPKGKELCTERFGANKILGKPLERDDFPADFFSVVTLCDVIEHIPDPVDFLATVYHILEPGGVLIVITPDTASWTHFVMGRRWPHYKTEHLHYFNRANLAKLCADHFAVLTAERAYKSLTIGYMASVINAYSHNATARISARLSSFLPYHWRTKAFKLSIGEMLMILRKRADANQ
jgi:2-polyprenyl-3-methyl-5-hydroxy-6-metoxy-1,4-benzoquinol methylase